MTLLGIASLPFVFHYWNAFNTFLVMMGIMLCFILSARLPEPTNPVVLVSRLYAWLARWATRLPYLSRRISSDSPNMSAYHLDRSTITKMNSITSLRLFLLVARYSLVALAFRLNDSYLIFWIATPLSLLTLLIGFFPGGLGVVDLSMYALLISSNSMNASEATLFVIGNRLFSIISLLVLFVIDQMVMRVHPHIRRI